MCSPSSRELGANNGLPAAGAGSLVALVLIGLLADVAPTEEAYAGVGYGLSLLAFLGATGCAVRLTSRLAARLDPLPRTSSIAAAARAFAPAPGLSARGGAWPVLVALLFGPLVVLTSGLGGWV